MSNGQRWAFIFIGLFGVTELAWVAYAATHPPKVWHEEVPYWQCNGKPATNNPKCSE